MFINSVPPRKPSPPEAPLRLMYAGGFIPSKGASVLIQALQRITSVNWRLDIAGGVSPEIAKVHAAFLGDPRVRAFGHIPRKELASRMTDADVFVFPSFSEGSARVVFEAMACGCYVIVTPNSGSLAVDGCHGAIVPPNSPEGLAEAVVWASTNRNKVRKIGVRNQELIRDSYTQAQYGEKLSALYSAVEPAAHVTRLFAAPRVFAD